MVTSNRNNSNNNSNSQTPAVVQQANADTLANFARQNEGVYQWSSSSRGSYFGGGGGEYIAPVTAAGLSATTAEETKEAAQKTIVASAAPVATVPERNPATPVKLIEYNVTKDAYGNTIETPTGKIITTGYTLPKSKDVEVVTTRVIPKESTTVEIQTQAQRINQAMAEAQQAKAIYEQENKKGFFKNLLSGIFSSGVTKGEPYAVQELKKQEPKARTQYLVDVYSKTNEENKAHIEYTASLQSKVNSGEITVQQAEELNRRDFDYRQQRIQTIEEEARNRYSETLKPYERKAKASQKIIRVAETSGLGIGAGAASKAINTVSKIGKIIEGTVASASTAQIGYETGKALVKKDYELAFETAIVSPLTFLAGAGAGARLVSGKPIDVAPEVIEKATSRAKVVTEYSGLLFEGEIKALKIDSAQEKNIIQLAKSGNEVRRVKTRLEPAAQDVGIFERANINPQGDFLIVTDKKGNLVESVGIGKVTQQQGLKTVGSDILMQSKGTISDGIFTSETTSLLGERKLIGEQGVLATPQERLDYLRRTDFLAQEGKVSGFNIKEFTKSIQKSKQTRIVENEQGQFIESLTGTAELARIKKPRGSEIAEAIADVQEPSAFRITKSQEARLNIGEERGMKELDLSSEFKTSSGDLTLAPETQIKVGGRVKAQKVLGRSETSTVQEPMFEFDSTGKPMKPFEQPQIEMDTFTTQVPKSEGALPVNLPNEPSILESKGIPSYVGGEGGEKSIGEFYGKGGGLDFETAYKGTLRDIQMEQMKITEPKRNLREGMFSGDLNAQLQTQAENNLFDNLETLDIKSRGSNDFRQMNELKIIDATISKPQIRSNQALNLAELEIQKTNLEQTQTNITPVDIISDNFTDIITPPPFFGGTDSGSGQIFGDETKPRRGRKRKPKYTASLEAAFAQEKPIKISKKQYDVFSGTEFSGGELREVVQVIPDKDITGLNLGKKRGRKPKSLI